MVLTKLWLSLIVTISLAACVFSQSANTPPVGQRQPVQKHDPFYADVIKSLDTVNPMRVVLEGGMRGHGPHYFWMDEMKARGIKQVHFEVGFIWYENTIRVRVTKANYLSNYFDLLHPKNDPKFLGEVTDSDFELQVKAEAESRAYEEVRMLMTEGKQKTGCGMIFKDLFDDERLPVISTQPAEVEHTGGAKLK